MVRSSRPPATYARTSRRSLVARLAARFLDTKGDLKEVSKTLITAPEAWDIFFGVTLILLVMEAMRRTNGWIMPFITACFMASGLAACYSPTTSVAVDELLKLVVEAKGCNFERPSNPHFGTAECNFSVNFFDDAQVEITRVDHGVPYMRMISLTDWTYGPEQKYETWFRNRYGENKDGRGNFIGYGGGDLPGRHESP